MLLEKLAALDEVDLFGKFVRCGGRVIFIKKSGVESVDGILSVGIGQRLLA
jgi:hypothetical protein